MKVNPGCNEGGGFCAYMIGNPGGQMIKLNLGVARSVRIPAS